MSPRIRPLLVLTCTFLFGGAAIRAQDSAGPLPPDLDATIAAALKSSPEVLLAEAKVRQAQAELNQTRLKITREVVSAFYEMKISSSARSLAQTRLDEAQRAAAAGAVPKPEVDQARERVMEGQLKVAQSEAALRYLCGVGSKLDPLQARPLTEPAAPRLARPRIPDNMADALNANVAGPFAKPNVAEFVKWLSDQTKVAIMLDPESFPNGEPDFAIEIPLREPTSLASVLQAMADRYSFCFLIRSYGIIVATDPRARRIKAASIPDDYPLNLDAK